MKNLPEYTKKKAFHKQHAFRSHGDEEDTSTPEVTVSLISHFTTDPQIKGGTEIILARNPDWDRVIVIPNFKLTDKLYISTSNGGVVTLTSDMLDIRSDSNIDFEVAVQNVTLASSLRMTIQKPNNLILNKDSGTVHSNTGGNPKKGSISTAITYIITIYNIISNDILQLIPFLLSIIVIITSIINIKTILHQNNILFTLFSLCNAIYILYYLITLARNRLFDTRGEQYTIRIHAHSFTSPDAPINSPEDDIPKRYIYIYVCVCIYVYDCMLYMCVCSKVYIVCICMQYLYMCLIDSMT